MIDLKEFKNAYATLYPKQDKAAIEERAVEVFKTADADGSGTIDFGEWCTASINKNKLLNEKNMKAAF